MAKTAPSGILKETDLLNSHRKLISTYINKNTAWKLGTKKKVLRLYDNNINKDNFRQYINCHSKILIVALIHGKLDSIKNYYHAKPEA